MLEQLSTNQKRGEAHSLTSASIALPVNQSGSSRSYLSSNQSNVALYKMYSGRFGFAWRCTTSTAMGLFGVGVIGMQVRQVARKPQECFVNGQLCI